MKASSESRDVLVALELVIHGRQNNNKKKNKKALVGVVGWTGFIFMFHIIKDGIRTCSSVRLGLNSI